MLLPLAFHASSLKDVAKRRTLGRLASLPNPSRRAPGLGTPQPGEVETGQARRRDSDLAPLLTHHV